jgi:hypothetical protein
MTLPTNEQVALWLDPDRKREGWWEHPYSWHKGLVFTGPDFTTPAACAEFVEPFLDLHDIWRLRGWKQSMIWFGAVAYFLQQKPAIDEDNHQRACLLAMAEVMK